MPKTIKTVVYSYAELNDKAKENARDWYIANCMDHDWWDGVYEDWEETLAKLGLSDFKAHFSGFWSQGDGAQFLGHLDIGTFWRAHQQPEAIMEGYNDWIERLNEHAAPEFEQLILKVEEVGSLSVRISSNGRYSHEYCTSFDFCIEELYPDPEIDDPDKAATDRKPVECLNDQIPALEEWVTETCRAYMKEFYRQLKQEYEYLTSEEAIAEAMEANEYTFTNNGRSFG